MPKFKYLLIFFALFVCFVAVPVRAANPQVNMNVTNGEVRDVLTALAAIGGVNMVVDDSVSGRITIELKNIPFETALDLVTRTKGLAYYRAGGVLVVATQDKIGKGFGSVHIMKMQYAKAEEVIDLLNIITERSKDGALIAPSAGSAPGSPGASLSSGLSTSVQGPTVVKPDVIKRIQTSGRLKADVETNSIVFYGTDEEAAEIAKLLQDIDTPYRQITLEAQVVAIQKTAEKNLGVEWQWNGVPATQQNTGTNSGSNPGNTSSSSTEQILPGYIKFGRNPDGQPYQFQFQATLNALYTNGDAKLLSRPKITAMNGKPARIHIGEQIPVPVTTVSGGSTTTSTEYKDAGIILLYTPRIDADGLIHATLYTGVSTPVWDNNAKGFRVAIREAETEVRMRDGETMIIGGLIGKDESSSKSKIPFLGDLPLLGKLFSNASSSNSENEVVIFLTAHIVK